MILDFTHELKSLVIHNCTNNLKFKKDYNYVLYMNFFAMSIDYIDDPIFFRKLKKYSSKNPPFQIILNMPLDETSWSRYNKLKHEYNINNLRL